MGEMRLSSASTPSLHIGGVAPHTSIGSPVSTSSQISHSTGTMLLNELNRSTESRLLMKRCFCCTLPDADNDSVDSDADSDDEDDDDDDDDDGELSAFFGASTMCEYECENGT